MTMQCPACERTLQEKTVDDVIVDVCDGGCGGIWFDQLELDKFDEPHDAAAQALLDVNRDTTIHVDHTGQIHCPRCEQIVMMRHFFSVKHEVEVDECPGCGGFWLDAGELRSIRTQYGSEAERSQAARTYFQEVFGDDLVMMEQESDEHVAKSRRIANMFRFICPSSYIPGEQGWGAF